LLIGDAHDLRQTQGETAEAHGDRAFELYYKLDDSGFYSAGALVAQSSLKLYGKIYAPRTTRQ
jgi:hypothetical protein